MFASQVEMLVKKRGCKCQARASYIYTYFIYIPVGYLATGLFQVVGVSSSLKIYWGRYDKFRGYICTRVRATPVLVSIYFWDIGK